MTETEALAAVEEARSALSKALDALREARGEPADEACEECDGTGNEPLAEYTLQTEPCQRCKGSGRRKRKFPKIVTRVKFDEEPLLRTREGTWVSVRPCAPEYRGKTYLGWLIGDIALALMVHFEDGTITIGGAHYNPAILVPDLNRIIFGAESWWSAIKTPEDLKSISDADINSAWYVKALKELS